jgi:hypothetical protein
MNSNVQTALDLMRVRIRGEAGLDGGGIQVYGYAVLWGSPEATDLSGSYFTPDTEFVWPENPLIPIHARDENLRSVAVGEVLQIGKTAVGLEVKAAVIATQQYSNPLKAIAVNMAQRIIAEGLYCWTVQGSESIIDSGRIIKWVVTNLLLTPTPLFPIVLESSHKEQSDVRRRWFKSCWEAGE